MAGDMPKWRAAAAKLAESTTLANTAIPTQRSKAAILMRYTGNGLRTISLPAGTTAFMGAAPMRHAAAVKPAM
jgi:hypothetical protein